MFCPLGKCTCDSIETCAPAVYRQQTLNATRDDTENQAFIQCPISEFLEGVNILVIAILPMLMGAQPQDAKDIDEYREMSEHEKVLEGLQIDQIPESGKPKNG